MSSPSSSTTTERIWRVSLGVGIPVLLLFPLLEMWLSSDAVELVYFLFAAPITILALIVVAWGSRRPVKWAVTLALTAGILSFFQYNQGIRAYVRWIFVSSSYRKTLKMQPKPSDGTLRHVEWDGSGFAGAENVDYLVLDSSRGLSHPAKDGRYPGLPCPVLQVHHLWKAWYDVEFYTDTSWDSCPY